MAGINTIRCRQYALCMTTNVLDVHTSKAAPCLLDNSEPWKLVQRISNFLCFIDWSILNSFFRNILLQCLVLSVRSPCSLNTSIEKQPTVTITVSLFTPVAAKKWSKLMMLNEIMSALRTHVSFNVHMIWFNKISELNLCFTLVQPSFFNEIWFFFI